MNLRLTHLLFAGSDDGRPPDALAEEIPSDSAEPSRRFFVPGWLPCGECGRCRRGWLAACPRGRRVAEAGASPLELQDRFLTAVDDPPGAAPLDDVRASCAGVVAEVQELAARAGLGTGDVAVWIGDDARCALGARLSATRGCASFHLGAASDTPRAGVTRLDSAAGAQEWTQALETAASAAPGGFQERRLFLARAEESMVASAVALATPGTALAFLDPRGPATLHPGDLPACRIIVAAGWGYHPDLVPEALAALRADEALAAGLMVEGPSSSPRDPTRLTLVRLV